MSSKKSCFVFTGETSGEEHALSFVPSLMSRFPKIHFYGVGGKLLKEQGMEIVDNIENYGSWGISEVIGRIPFYLNKLTELENLITSRGTSVAILVDFQDFNFRLAKRLKKRGVKVLYYVAPQAWAWRPWRAKTLSERVDALFCILPFEVKWFKKRGHKNVFMAPHPLRNSVEKSYLKTIRPIEKRNKILLLPGSRNTEVKNLLSVMLRSVENLDCEIGIVRADSVRKELYSVANDLSQVQFFSQSELTEALKWADAGISASGTVTLQAALYQLPLVVIYKVSLGTEFLIGILSTYRGPASLANIFHGKTIYPELLQNSVRVKVLRSEFLRIWTNDTQYRKIVKELQKTQSLILGNEKKTLEIMEEIIGKACDYESHFKNTLKSSSI